MDPIKLTIEDFLCYSKAEINFDEFSSAVVVAKRKGNDKISNGVGKSTIFSAIKYVLFNRVDSSTLDQVIRRGTDKCRISFDFSSDENTYRIVRCRTRAASTDIRLFRLIQGVWDEISSKTPSQTETEIAKIVKINYETFCNSVMFSARDLFFGLASLRPADKKKALKEALQLNIYGKFEKIASKKAGDIVKEIEKTKTIIGVLGEPDKDIETLNKELKTIITIIKDKIILYNTIKNQNDKEYEEYLQLKSKIEEFEKVAVLATQKKLSLKDDISKLSSITEDYDKKLISLQSAGKALSREIEDTYTYIQSHTHDNINVSKIELEKLASNILEKKTRKHTLSIRLATLEIPLPDDSECKYCRQTISDKHRIECQSDIDREVVELKLALQNITKNLQDEQINEVILKRKIDNIEKSITDINHRKSLIELKQKEIENKRSLYKEYKDLLDKNKTTLQIKSDELDTVIKSQNIEHINEYNKLKIQIAEHKTTMLQSYKQVEDLSKEITSYSNNQAVLLHKKETRSIDIEKIINLKTDIFLLEGKYGLHQKVIQAFGSGGIPALIIHTILDDFQIETNNLLSQLRPGLQVQFSVIKERGDGDKDDTLDITYALNGWDLEYAMLSQAQKLLVSLCLKLGLASVIKKRLGTDIKLFLIDEADQSLDDESLEAFEAAIKKLQKDFKILIITHNQNLKEKFSHKILVEQDDNFVSTIRVEND